VRNGPAVTKCAAGPTAAAKNRPAVGLRLGRPRSHQARRQPCGRHKRRRNSSRWGRPSHHRVHSRPSHHRERPPTAAVRDGPTVTERATGPADATNDGPALAVGNCRAVIECTACPVGAVNDGPAAVVGPAVAERATYPHDDANGGPVCTFGDGLAERQTNGSASVRPMAVYMSPYTRQSPSGLSTCGRGARCRQVPQQRPLTCRRLQRRACPCRRSTLARSCTSSRPEEGPDPPLVRLAQRYCTKGKYLETQRIIDLSMQRN
jgi:hypothetical protein